MAQNIWWFLPRRRYLWKKQLQTIGWQSLFSPSLYFWSLYIWSLSHSYHYLSYHYLVRISLTCMQKPRANHWSIYIFLSSCFCRPPCIQIWGPLNCFGVRRLFSLVYLFILPCFQFLCLFLRLFHGVSSWLDKFDSYLIHTTQRHKEVQCWLLRCKSRSFFFFFLKWCLHCAIVRAVLSCDSILITEKKWRKTYAEIRRCMKDTCCLDWIIK